MYTLSFPDWIHLSLSNVSESFYPTLQLPLTLQQEALHGSLRSSLYWWGISVPKLRTVQSLLYLQGSSSGSLLSVLLNCTATWNLDLSSAFTSSTGSSTSAETTGFIDRRKSCPFHHNWLSIKQSTDCHLVGRSIWLCFPSHCDHGFGLVRLWISVAQFAAKGLPFLRIQFNYWDYPHAELVFSNLKSI